MLVVSSPRLVYIDSCLMGFHMIKMIPWFHLGAAISLLVVLFGCMTYPEPTSGPRARVRFSTDNPRQTVIYRYADEDCRMDESRMMILRTFEWQMCPYIKRLGMPLWDYPRCAAGEVFVKADEMFYGLVINFIPAAPFGPEHLGALVTGMAMGGKHPRVIPMPQSQSTERCILPVTFRFNEGEDYEVLTKWESCTIDVFKIQPDESGQMRRVSQALPPPSLNQGCFDAAVKPRLY